MPSDCFDIAHRTLGHAVFVGRMSHNARTILILVVEAINSRGMIYGGSNPLLERFVQEYEPAVYEDAVLGWDWRGLQKVLKAQIKRWNNATTDDIISTATLSPLLRRQWDVPVRPQHQFRFTQSSTHTEIYKYISTEFLLDDFSEGDLYKISEISKTHSVEDVKHACTRIEQPDKKVVSYLYRVLSNAERTDAAMVANSKRRIDESERQIAQTIANVQSTGFKVPYNPDWMHDIAITRAMRDIYDEDE